MVFFRFLSFSVVSQENEITENERFYAGVSRWKRLFKSTNLWKQI